jgi:hypothetical protein
MEQARRGGPRHILTGCALTLGCALVLAACSGSTAPTSAATSAAVNPTVAPTSTSGPPPSTVPEATHPPLTRSFTSAVHGFSVSYPEGWTPRAATESWPENEIVMQESAFGDVIEDLNADNLFLAMASRPIDDDAFGTFASSYLDVEECGPGDATTVAGADGVIGSACPLAIVHEGGRAYLFWLYGDDDIAWFKEILATVKLEPEAAVD